VRPGVQRLDVDGRQRRHSCELSLAT
jgi:hypothetical protein